MTQAEILALLRQKAEAFAAAQGRPQDAESFFRAIAAIAYGESGLRPDAIRDTTSGYDPLVASGQAQRELSVGLFQNNLRGGRGTGYSVEALKDPNLNIEISLPSLWNAFQRNGGAAAFSRDPEGVTARTYQQGQGSVPPSLDAQVRPGLALTAGNAALSGTIVQGSPPAPQQSAPVAPARPTTPAATRADPDSSPTTLAAPRAQDGTASTASPAQPRSARYDQQLDALWSQLAALDQEARQIRSKPPESRTAEDQARLTELEGEYGFPGQIDAVYERIKTLEQVRPEDADDPEAQFPSNAANFDINTLGAQANLATGALGNRNDAYATVAGLTNTDASLGIAQANLTNAYYDGIQQALKDVYGARDTRATLIYNILDGNRQDAQEQVRSAMAKGQLDMQAAENVMTAIAARQAAHLGYAAKVLERAQWISDTQWRNVRTRLPQGTIYQPGFEPDSTLNSSLKALGLEPTVIHAAIAADYEVDPLAALQASDTSFPVGARPGKDYDEAVAGVQAAAARTQDIKPYQGQEINESDLPLSNLQEFDNATMAAARNRPVPDFTSQRNAIAGYAYGVLGNAQTYDDVASSYIGALDDTQQQYTGPSATWRQPRVVQNPNATTQQGATAQSSIPTSAAIVPSSQTPATSHDDLIAPGGHWEGDDFVFADGRVLRGARSNPRAVGLAA